jgi:hypothetical protein
MHAVPSGVDDIHISSTSQFVAFPNKKSIDQKALPYRMTGRIKGAKINDTGGLLSKQKVSACAKGLTPFINPIQAHIEKHPSCQ